MKYYRIIAPIVGLAIGIAWFYSYHVRTSEAIASAYKDFPLLQTSDSLSGAITEIYCIPEVSCTAPPVFAIVDSRTKVSIMAYKDLEGKIQLVKMLKEGVRLYKRSNSDTLVVTDGKLTARFITTEILLR